MQAISTLMENLIFAHKRKVIALFILITLAMAYFSSQLKVDAGFMKLLPLKHEYMQVFVKYRNDFGGANRIVIALQTSDEDIFSAEFFDTLKAVTDEVFFIPGVDRTRVNSLFTPNTRFTEVVEDGIAGGNVIPNDFQNREQDLARVRKNIIKAGIVGRLVANDFSGAIVSAELQDFNPSTGEALNLVEVAEQLETNIREKYQSETISVHVIGFAKVIGDITNGAARVLVFFLIAFLITSFLVYIYTQSLKVTLVPIICSLVAVVWQLGLLSLLGFGIDPMSILVPFLVFAIAVSHGVAMVSVIGSEVFMGANAEQAARASFRRLLLPGFIALASDTIGFITILLIEIQIIQEMAITASIGVAVVILTNLVLLPVVVSFLNFDDSYRKKLQRRSEKFAPMWRSLSRITQKKNAAVIIMLALLLLAVGVWKGTEVHIGDLHTGVPELRPDSVYNLDTAAITERFSIGVDVLSVMAETKTQGCIDYNVMKTIDEFDWHMRNVAGVQSVVSLPSVAKVINAGWNEGHLKWRVLPRNEQVMVQALAYIPTSSGLLNSDCSVMPVYLFTEDHKASTISNIVAEVKSFAQHNSNSDVEFRLAANNVGVMAATNEVVAETQFPILLYVFAAVILFCLISFRSWQGTLCIVLPLALVSLLAYALMSLLQIGLKVNTLPVVALGVGIGVDYGIYIFSRLQSELQKNDSLGDAYFRTLNITGNGVVFTGFTLAVGVATWIFSPLQFQADMGILLTFMFLLNMLGAILVLPALAAWLLPKQSRRAATTG